MIFFARKKVRERMIFIFTDGNGGIKDLKTDFGPLAEGIQVDTSVNEGLGQVTTTGLQGIGADGHGPGNLVGLQELNQLGKQELKK